MRRILTALTFAALATATIAAPAQETGYDPTQFVPRANVAVGYQFIRSNAPPGQSPSVDLNGGFLSAGVKLKFWLSVAGEITGTRATQISSLGQNLTLLTYTAGPRVTFRRRHTVPFAQALFGAAHGGDSFFPSGNSYTTSANSFAIQAGGGLDYELSHRFAIRAIEAEYLHTGFNNGVNTSQNHLMLGAGLTFKFHGRYARPHAPAAPPEPKLSDMSCSANLLNVEAGQPLVVTGAARPRPGDADVSYTWTSTAGTVAAQNNTASIDTGGLAPGMYSVTGHAALASDSTQVASCDVPFRVLEPRVMPAPIVIGVATAPPLPASMKQQDVEFHDHVQDAYFDYDKWNLRPDTTESIAAAAEYLKAHPSLNVLVGGFSDERGTPEYNLSLGEKRANAARDALIEDGVDGARIQVVSYGKGVQVCTKPTEPCYQKNRRAAFMLQP